MKTYADFRAFSQAGRDLTHWHLNYETVACHPGVAMEEGKMADAATGDRRYRVTKMKFGKTKGVNERNTVIHNEITSSQLFQKSTASIWMSCGSGKVSATIWTGKQMPILSASGRAWASRRS
jgi:predicted helicase